MSDVKDILQHGRRVLELEGRAVLNIAEGLGESFRLAVEAILACQGKVVLTGVGKAGIVGQKISATFASTGTLSIFMHPVEALHGDLGRLMREDVVIALSNSGSSEEILRLLDHIKRRGAKLIALTGPDGSPLARYADITLSYGNVEEACPLGAAPSVSTTCMLALGDALSLTVMQRRQFGPEQYAEFHPGGALGRKFLKVSEVMSFREGEKLSTAEDSLTLAEALATVETTRRTGAMLLVDSTGKLSGILTDADIRRLLLKNPGKDVMTLPVRQVMTAGPKCIGANDLASQAEAILNKYRIDELPVVDGNGHPVGVVDVQDLLGLKALREGESS